MTGSAHGGPADDNDVGGVSAYAWAWKNRLVPPR